MNSKFRDQTIELLNLYTRGLNAALGSGCGIVNEVKPIKIELHPELGYNSLVNEVSRNVGNLLDQGDIVACCSVVFSRAQKRIVSKEDFLKYGYPEALNYRKRNRLIKELAEKYTFSIDKADIIGSSVSQDKNFIDLLPENPNKIAYDLSSKIISRYKIKVDSEITDTTAGLAGKTYIGIPTIGATPIGATKGISLKNALRIAIAADFLMGSDKGIPLVVIKPERNSCQTWRSLDRKNIGEFRYDGRINAMKERGSVVL